MGGRGYCLPWNAKAGGTAKVNGHACVPVVGASGYARNEVAEEEEGEGAGGQMGASSLRNVISGTCGPGDWYIDVALPRTCRGRWTVIPQLSSHDRISLL